MDKDLIIDVENNVASIALLENKRLKEFSKETLNAVHFSVGDVYLGKVHKVMPSLNAAFVDIGDEKDAFIHYSDLSLSFTQVNSFTQQMLARSCPEDYYARMKLENKVLDKEGRIADVLKPGQALLVQIVKEPISTKGSRLSSEISLAGRNMVLIPFSSKVNISSKITAKDERRRLERLIQSILPPNYGLIIRTAAQGKKAAVLDSELRFLIRKWESSWPILRNNARAPLRLLSENSRITTILRDILNDSFTNITVNDESVYNEVLHYIATIAPEQEKIVKLYKGREPVFDVFDVERQIKSAFGRIVALKQGIYLIIEHTEALHVVDVNSGVRTKMASDQEENAYEVNLIAAEELARQLRLRDMGGIIIVDFIDMDKAEHRQKLFKKMEEFMADDRAKHNILPLTKFGLMQITRQRVRPVLEINTTEKCPTCNGTGKISSTLMYDDVLENRLSYLVNERGLKELHLKVHPFVEAFLTKGMLNSKLRQWRKKYKVKLKVSACNEIGVVEAQWLDADEKILENV